MVENMLMFPLEYIRAFNGSMDCYRQWLPRVTAGQIADHVLVRGETSEVVSTRVLMPGFADYGYDMGRWAEELRLNLTEARSAAMLVDQQRMRWQQPQFDFFYFPFDEQTIQLSFQLEATTT